MTVIDKLLKEWSFRCHDGIVDLNDPNKVKILEEITKDELKNLIDIAELDPEQLNKIKKFVTKRTKKLGLRDELQKLLTTDKGLKRYASSVIFSAEQQDEEEKLKNYLNNPTLIFNDIEKGNNLITVFEKTGLNSNFIKDLINITSNQIGAGELALITFLKDARKLYGTGQGDFKVEEKVIEIKGKGSNIAEERGGKKSIVDAFKEIPYTENDLKGDWLKKVEDDLKDPNIDDNKKEKIKEVVKSFYPFEIDFNNLRESIAEYYIEKYAENYFKGNRKIDYLLFLNETNGNYKMFNESNFKTELIKNIDVSFTKDIFPRMSLKQSIQEEPTLDEILFSLRPK